LQVTTKKKKTAVYCEQYAYCYIGVLFLLYIRGTTRASTARRCLLAACHSSKASSKAVVQLVIKYTVARRERVPRYYTIYSSTVYFLTSCTTALLLALLRSTVARRMLYREALHLQRQYACYDACCTAKALHVCAYYYMCVLILVCMCLHASICVSSCCCIYGA
jgi:hypothetical protein